MDTHPSPFQMIVRFEDLIGDTEEVVRRFTDQFGYPAHPQLTEIVQQAVADAIANRSEHRYDYTEMGFTREQIVSEFATIFDRLGFDRREPLHQPSLPVIVNSTAD